MYSLLLLLPTLYKVIQSELLLYYDQVAMILGQGALSLAISRAFGWVRRRTFLYKVLIRQQLETLGAILFDLVPPHYAVQVLPPPRALVDLAAAGSFFCLVYFFLLTTPCSYCLG